MKSKKGMIWLMWVLCVIVVALVADPELAVSAQVFRWRAQTLLLPQVGGHTDFVKWCNNLKVASEGRLDIKPYAVGEIVPASEQWEAVGRGVIEMAYTSGGLWMAKTPMAAFSSGIPFTLRDVQDYYVAFLRLGMENLVRAAYAKHNIYFLRQSPCLDAVMLSRKPVNKAADLKGTKIRAMGMIGETLAEMGATIMFVPGPEIYGALEKGIIDACVYGPLAPQYESGLHEVTKYIIMPPVLIGGDQVIVNMNAWKALPDDLQKLLYLSDADFTEQLAVSYRYDSEKALDACLKKGLKVLNWPEADRAKLREAAWRVVEKYSAKDPDFAKGAGILKDYLKLTGISK